MFINKSIPSTEPPKIPTWSTVSEKGMTPSVGISPSDGLNPTRPQNAAGRMTEPMVCDPNAQGKKPAATPAAEPLLDPPGVWRVFQGLRVGPGSK